MGYQFEVLMGGNDALRRFLNSNFRYQLTESEFLHLVTSCPDGPARFYVLKNSDGDLIGSYGVLPNPLKLNGQSTSFGLAAYLAIKKEMRSPALFAEISEFAFIKEAELGTKALFGPPNPSGYRAHRFLAGWEDIIALKVIRAVPGSISIDSPVLYETPDITPEHWGVINATQNQHQLFRPRTHQRLNWRYSTFPGRKYRFLEWREGQQVRGLAVIKHWRDSGGEKVHIMDAFALGADDMSPLISGIAKTVAHANEINAWGDERSSLIMNSLALGFSVAREQPLIAKYLRNPIDVHSHGRPILFTYGDAEGY